MLRGLWALAMLVALTLIFALPVMLVALLVPAWSDLSMRAGKLWSRGMLAAVGARVRYHGLERALAAAPCVYIANHQSFVDVWALIRVLPPKTRFVAKHELFRIPVFGWALRAAGFVSVDRTNRTEAIRSLDRATERIQAGGSLVLFPEGTRSRDGSVGPFKKGAFHLALRAGVPVVPVAIRGSFEVLPPDGFFAMRPGPVDVHFEPPVDVGAYAPDGQARLRADVHAAIVRRLEEAATARRAAR